MVSTMSSTLLIAAPRTGLVIGILAAPALALGGLLLLRLART